MKFKNLLIKGKRKVWDKIVFNLKDSVLYPYIYRSYWHYLLNKDQVEINSTCFYSAIPNPGAGIGHQMANWIAGYWFAKIFNLKFAHYPFSNQKWDNFLGFSEDSVKVTNLLNQGFKLRKLPKFDEYNTTEVQRVQNIIKSYSKKKIIFIAEQDQIYFNQHGIINIIQQKFYNSTFRKHDNILYNSNKINIAVHVRRTVIIDGKATIEDEKARSLRWLHNNYYEQVLKQTLENVKTDKEIDIYLFTTGKVDEFAQFSKYANMHICNTMDEYNSFAHLVKADILITSKSSFSYKPALLNKGIKICPQNFWHGYPDNENWILVDNEGNFDTTKLIKHYE